MREHLEAGSRWPMMDNLFCRHKDWESWSGEQPGKVKNQVLTNTPFTCTDLMQLLVSALQAAKT